MELFQTYFCMLLERVLDHYNTFVIHCQCHTCYTSANYCSEKSCIALILLFYSRHLVACIRLLLLWVVCMCAIAETVKQLSQRTHLEFICPCLWTCDLRLVISVLFMLF